MAITDPFIRIPRRLTDPRPCLRRRWLQGINIDSTPDRLWPHAIASDGNGGSYAITTKSTSGGLRIELHHLDASGVKSGPALLDSFNWLKASAKLIPSRDGTCIAIWSYPWNNNRPLLAQRFDAACNPLWALPVEVAQISGGGFYTVGASGDGADGAIVAFLRGPGDFRVQRVSVAGALQFGPSGNSMGNPFIHSPEHVTHRIFPAGNGYVLLWTDYVPVWGTVKCIWLDQAGQITAGPFEVTRTGENWWEQAGTCRAFPDGMNGFWVAAAPRNFVGLPLGGPLQLLRFDGGGVLPAVTVTSRTLATPETYAVAPDGNGGIFVAAVSPTGSVTLDHFNSAGAPFWPAKPGYATIAIGNFNQFPVGFDPLSARVVSVGVRDVDSAILAFVDDNFPASSQIRFRCIDRVGRAIGPEVNVSPTSGSHRAILLNQPWTPTGAVQVGRLVPAVGPPDSDTVRCIWLTESNIQSVSAQKLGCCPEVYDVDLVPNPFTFDCAIPVDFPQTIPGTLNVSFPCNRESIGDLGFLPLPQMTRIPGLNLPGCLATPSVPPPDWVRLVFSNVPENVQLQLYSHTGDQIAVAKAFPGELSGMTREITFKPKAQLGYLLAVIRKPADNSPQTTRLGVTASFGKGRARALPVPVRNLRVKASKIKRHAARKK